jgi:hypothetical protein
MVAITSRKSAIAVALDDLAESQNLAVEARAMTANFGLENDPGKALSKLEVICAILEKSISLNAAAMEAIGDIQDQPEISDAKRLRSSLLSLYKALDSLESMTPHFPEHGVLQAGEIEPEIAVKGVLSVCNPIMSQLLDMLNGEGNQQQTYPGLLHGLKKEADTTAGALPKGDE